MTANTQNFRVKHGLDVSENTILKGEISVANAATFGNTVSIANTLSTQSIQASNTVTISNTKLTISGPNIEGSNDAIEVSRGATNLRDTYITGDLVVTGATSLTSTERFDVGTNEIVISAGLKGDQAPSSNANIIVNRGSSANVFIRWDETNDRWMFTDDGSAVYPLKTYNDITYLFNTATDGSISTGQLAFDSATPASITTVSIHNTDGAGEGVSSFLTGFTGSGSIKGSILVRSSTDQTKYLLFNITGSSTASSITDFTVSFVGGSSSVFSSNEVLFAQLLRAGDKGETGATGDTGDKGQKGDTGDKGETGDTGDKGEKGEIGAQVAKGELKGDGSLSLYLDDVSETEINVSDVKGDKGITGDKGVTGDKGEIGDKGEVGDKGEKGEVGAQPNKGELKGDGSLSLYLDDVSATEINVPGVKGNTGPQGPTGTAATIAVGSVTTVASASATVTNSGTSSSATFDFNLPKGEQGPTGPTGATGPQGPTGDAATIAVGTVTTVASASASINNSGTSGAAIFDFNLPKGEQGATGPQGSAGTIAVGTVTTVASASATVTNSGTSSAAVLNFNIPKGEKGEEGAVGTNQDARVNSLGVGTPAPGTTGEIRAAGNITAYFSDDRLKTRIGNIENALEKLLSLNGFYYKANELAQSYGYEVKDEVGVSAQEVQKVLPEVVVPAPIDDKFLTVRYEKMIPLLLEAIKELASEVNEIKKTISDK